MEMQMYYGEDEGDDEEVDSNSPGGIVIEALSNIRTVASLNLEEQRAAEYAYALEKEDPHPIKSNVTKGMTSTSEAELLISPRIFFHDLLRVLFTGGAAGLGSFV
jgi:hypothetical protein